MNYVLEDHFNPYFLSTVFLMIYISTCDSKFSKMNFLCLQYASKGIIYSVSCGEMVGVP